MKKVTLQKKLPLQLITVEPDLKAMGVRNYNLTFTNYIPQKNPQKKMVKYHTYSLIILKYRYCVL